MKTASNLTRPVATILNTLINRATALFIVLCLSLPLLSGSIGVANAAPTSRGQALTANDSTDPTTILILMLLLMSQQSHNAQLQQQPPPTNPPANTTDPFGLNGVDQFINGAATQANISGGTGSFGAAQQGLAYANEDLLIQQSSFPSPTGSSARLPQRHTNNDSSSTSTAFGSTSFQTLNASFADFFSILQTGQPSSLGSTIQANNDGTLLAYLYNAPSENSYSSLRVMTVYRPYWNNGVPGSFPCVIGALSAGYVDNVSVIESIGLRFDDAYGNSGGITIALVDGQNNAYEFFANYNQSETVYELQGKSGDGTKSFTLDSTVINGTQTLVLTMGSLTENATVNSNGSGQMTISKNGALIITINFNADQSGTYTYSANGASGSFTNLSDFLSTLSLTPTAVNTTTALASSQNPSTVGQNVTFTATVTPTGGSAVPTGTVQFAVDGVNAPGTPYTLDGNGQATDTEYGLSQGAHTITAVYIPTGAFNASQGSFTQTVNAVVVTNVNTATAVASSLNPSTVGQNVTFTATVTANSGSNTPTGTVQFALDGSNSGGPVTLDGSGNATDTEYSLTAGTHHITATYIPDGAFNGSGGSVTQTVNAVHVGQQYVSPSGSDSNDGSQNTPKLTIQAAINACQDGDSVTIEDGTYRGTGNRDLDFMGKNITVQSQNGPAATIIDCGGSSSAVHFGFYLHSGETSAVISGLTIENGYDSYGGGAFIAAGTQVSVTYCTFSGNTALGGGGILNLGAATLTNCTFSGNKATGSNTGGGGVDNAGSLTLTDCTFSGNTDSGNLGGGGLSNFLGNVTLTDCLFSGNAASSTSGGGIYNSPTGSGSLSGAVSVTNCTFTQNTAAAAKGGGVYNGKTMTLMNDILYGDTGGEISGSGLTVTNCDVQGGYAGTGNINADPLFNNAPNDLHLQFGSPCTGAGTANGAPNADLDGNARPNPPSIGAYEGQAPVATTTTLTTSQALSTVGQSVTFTATVTATSGTPTGTVQFAIDGSSVGSPVTLDGSGKAMETETSLTAGTHSVTAAYTPTGAFSGSTASAVTQIVNAAAATGSVHVLWHNGNSGQTALWAVGADGTVTAHAYGPFGGWTSQFVADGPDGLAHLLWTNTDGHIAVWTIAANGTPNAVTYGPVSGWTPLGLAVGPDNHTHILWNHTADNQMSLWDIAPGAAPTGTAYGPFSGYTAGKLAVSPDNHVHVLWTVQGGGIALWDLAPGAAPVGYPYSVPAGYAAVALAAGPDNRVHVLWDYQGDSIALWNVDAGGVPTGIAFGPYSGYTAGSLAVGADNHTHVLWTVGGGGNALWDLAPGVNPTGALYQPGDGWGAVALSAAP